MRSGYGRMQLGQLRRDPVANVDAWQRPHKAKAVCDLIRELKGRGLVVLSLREWERLRQSEGPKGSTAGAGAEMLRAGNYDEDPACL